MDISEASMKKVGSVLKGHGFIRVAYVFGSVAEGRHGPLSDVDIAVFMDERLGKAERNRKARVLFNDISSVLRTDRIDVVVMNDAPLLMNYNVIRNGKVIKQGKERVALETRLMSEYLDRRFYDDMYTDFSLKRIAKEGIM